MRAWTAELGASSPKVTVRDIPEPDFDEGLVCVRTLAVGVCGTDRDILRGHHGEAPPGEDSLILGHESVGRVEAAPRGSALQVGDLVVAMVRQPDPVPCAACARGEWDMCRNGRFTEHGIKGRHGFARDRYRVDASRLVRAEAHLGLAAVLIEPASVVAKAWEQIDRIGARSYFAPARALVTGAGTVGLLASLMARQRGLELTVLDRVQTGPRPALARQLGARYCSELEAALTPPPDIIVECTGAGELVLKLLGATEPAGILCLTGLSSGGQPRRFDPHAFNQELVLGNEVVLGSVNANRRHYQDAVEALSRADTDWLNGLLTRRVPLAEWRHAFESAPDTDVKTVLELSE